MSTTLAKPAEMADRKWYVIDAAGKPLGRVAAKAAVILRGKNKTTFTPNVDCGDHVIIINCDQAVLGMVPSNTIGTKAMTRLHCYKAADHAHAAQKPEAVEI